MPGWIFWEWATASATARCGAPTFIVHNIRRGGPSSPSSTRHGCSLTSLTDLHLSPRLWLWRGPRTPPFSPCAPAFFFRGNPGSTLRLWSDGGYASEVSWQVAMVAWRNVATSEDGDHPCRQVSPLRLWLLLAFTQHKQLPYTVHIQAALGGDGPRWRPLNVAVAMSEQRDAGGELPGRRQRQWQHTVATGWWPRFILSWGQAATAGQWQLLNGVGFQIMCFYSYVRIS